MNIPKTKRKILTYPNPYLREEARSVEHFDESLHTLFNEMCDLMHLSDGVGLAATQVGVSLKLLVLSSYVFMSPEARKEVTDGDREMGEDIAVINPVVVDRSEDILIDYEGCLSFPEVYIKVKRPSWVKIRAQNLEGDFIDLHGEGFGARAILHEMDHLTGKVMTDHLSFLARQKALKDHQRIQKHMAKETAAESDISSVNPTKKSPKGHRAKPRAHQKKKAKKSNKKRR